MCGVAVSHSSSVRRLSQTSNRLHILWGYSDAFGESKVFMMSLSASAQEVLTWNIPPLSVSFAEGARFV